MSTRRKRKHLGWKLLHNEKKFLNILPKTRSQNDYQSDDSDDFSLLLTPRSEIMPKLVQETLADQSVEGLQVATELLVEDSRSKGALVSGERSCDFLDSKVSSDFSTLSTGNGRNIFVRNQVARKDFIPDERNVLLNGVSSFENVRGSLPLDDKNDLNELSQPKHNVIVKDIILQPFYFSDETPPSIIHHELTFDTENSSITSSSLDSDSTSSNSSITDTPKKGVMCIPTFFDNKMNNKSLERISKSNTIQTFYTDYMVEENDQQLQENFHVDNVNVRGQINMCPEISETVTYELNSTSNDTYDNDSTAESYTGRNLFSQVDSEASNSGSRHDFVWAVSSLEGSLPLNAQLRPHGFDDDLRLNLNLLDQDDGDNNHGDGRSSRTLSSSSDKSSTSQKSTSDDNRPTRTSSSYYRSIGAGDGRRSIQIGDLNQLLDNVALGETSMLDQIIRVRRLVEAHRTNMNNSSSKLYNLVDRVDQLILNARRMRTEVHNMRCGYSMCEMQIGCVYIQQRKSSGILGRLRQEMEMDIHMGTVISRLVRKDEIEGPISFLNVVQFKEECLARDKARKNKSKQSEHTQKNTCKVS